MKTILLLVGAGGALFWLGLSSTHNHKATADAQAAAALAASRITSDLAHRNEARKFDLDIQTIPHRGEAIALAACYDIPPPVTPPPKKPPPAKSGWRQAGQIYITGLPDGVVDGRHHLPWPTPAGARTYTDRRGDVHTIPAYT